MVGLVGLQSARRAGELGAPGGGSEQWLCQSQVGKDKAAQDGEGDKPGEGGEGQGVILEVEG